MNKGLPHKTGTYLCRHKVGKGVSYKVIYKDAEHGIIPNTPFITHHLSIDDIEESINSKQEEKGGQCL
jgi:hypothetical protein